MLVHFVLFLCKVVLKTLFFWSIKINRLNEIKRYRCRNRTPIARTFSAEMIKLERNGYAKKTEKNRSKK